MQGETHAGHKTKIKNLCIEYGFESEGTNYITPLWMLKCWKNNFYYRFALCFMHTFAHGVIKRTICKLSQKYDKD